MKNKEKEIDVEIGSHEMAIWDRLVKHAERTIKQCEDEILVQSEILKLSRERYKEAEADFQK